MHCRGCRRAAGCSCDATLLPYLTTRCSWLAITSLFTEKVRMLSANVPQTSTAFQARTSARIEVLLVVWRIREALTSLPRNSTDADLTVRRWNHGIARELVCSKLFNNRYRFPALTARVPFAVDCDLCVGPYGSYRDGGIHCRRRRQPELPTDHVSTAFRNMGYPPTSL